MMRSDARRDGMLRPDLLQALSDLRPSFIRWPGGSFASTYKWQEGIGPYAARGYHPNLSGEATQTTTASGQTSSWDSAERSAPNP